MTITRLRRREDAQCERKKLRVQRYISRLRIGQGRVRLTKGRLRAKFCNDACPKLGCKQSPAMMFAQGWIASKVLRWCLPKDRSRAKSCNVVCPRVDCKQSPAMMFNQGISAQGQMRWQFGELQRENCKRKKMLITTDENSQTLIQIGSKTKSYQIL